MNETKPKTLEVKVCPQFLRAVPVQPGARQPRRGARLSRNSARISRSTHRGEPYAARTPAGTPRYIERLPRRVAVRTHSPALMTMPALTLCTLLRVSTCSSRAEPPYSSNSGVSPARAKPAGWSFRRCSARTLRIHPAEKLYDDFWRLASRGNYRRC